MRPTLPPQHAFIAGLEDMGAETARMSSGRDSPVAYATIPATLSPAMGSLIKKRRKRMRKKKHKKMLKATRWQRRAGK